MQYYYLVAADVVSVSWYMPVDCSGSGTGSGILGKSHCHHLASLAWLL